MSRPLPVSVLMVEDSADDAELLLRELLRRGFAPAAARVDTGEALSTALKTRAWDIVISDNSMPGFSGGEALRVVKQAAPDLPFIVVSGTLSEEHAVDAMRAGASDFVTKSKLHRLAPIVERELQESARRAEQRRTADALADARQQLRRAQKLEAVSRLAAGVAHDFNNLLGAMLSYVSLASHALPAHSEAREDLLEIKELVGRAAEVVRQLLAFSRQQVLNHDVLNLSLVVHECLGLLRQAVGDGVSIASQYEGFLWEIKGDRQRIEQVLVNLAINAREAMPGGGTLTISTSNVTIENAGEPGEPDGTGVPSRSGDYVCLRVSDTGCGIPQDALPKIFEPFFSTKEPGTNTGLGLATVYGIIEQSGGCIFVESQPGTGATFTIYLPRWVEPEARTPVVS